MATTAKASGRAPRLLGPPQGGQPPAGGQPVPPRTAPWPDLVLPVRLPELGGQCIVVGAPTTGGGRCEALYDYAQDYMGYLQSCNMDQALPGDSTRGWDTFIVWEYGLRDREAAAVEEQVLQHPHRAEYITHGDWLDSARIVSIEVRDDNDDSRASRATGIAVGSHADARRRAALFALILCIEFHRSVDQELFAPSHLRAPRLVAAAARALHDSGVCVLARELCTPYHASDRMAFQQVARHRPLADHGTAPAAAAPANAPSAPAAASAAAAPPPPVAPRGAPAAGAGQRDAFDDPSWPPMGSAPGKKRLTPRDHFRQQRERSVHFDDDGGQAAGGNTAGQAAAGDDDVSMDQGTGPAPAERRARRPYNPHFSGLRCNVRYCQGRAIVGLCDRCGVAVCEDHLTVSCDCGDYRADNPVDHNAIRLAFRPRDASRARLRSRSAQRGQPPPGPRRGQSADRGRPSRATSRGDGDRRGQTPDDGGRGAGDRRRDDHASTGGAPPRRQDKPAPRRRHPSAPRDDRAAAAAFAAFEHAMQERRARPSIKPTPWTRQRACDGATPSPWRDLAFRWLGVDSPPLREVCGKYNHPRGCDKAACPRIHACHICGREGHPATECTKGQNRVPTLEERFGNEVPPDANRFEPF